MENELETIDSSNDNEEVETIDSTNDDEVEVVEDEEEEQEQEEKYTPREKQLYARLKKAEQQLNEKGTKSEAPHSDTLSSSDLLAVMKANIHEDDMERVEKFAKSEGMSIKDALKNDELKAILSVREEKRNTASAANVSNTRATSHKVSDDVIIANANKGKLPEDDAGIERLIAAKRKLK